MDALFRIVGLKKYFPIKSGPLRTVKDWLRAVDGVDLEIPRNQVLGLVGESGSGKTTAGRTIIRLLEPTAGQLFFDGQDLLNADRETLRQLRSKIQMIFQDPKASLNPRMRIGTIIKRTLDIHTRKTNRDKRDRVMELLQLMGLLPEHYNRYPHELSGGQQQRVGIARALAADPRFVVMDEPTSSLDVSVQAQILNLLKRLQREFQLTVLFISHDMRVINHICNRVAVMYAGRLVEVADRDRLFFSPRHPYSRLLLSSVPEIGQARAKKEATPGGDVPSPAAPPAGCRFHPRCPQRSDGCDRIDPPLVEVGPGHYCACLHQTSLEAG